MTDDFMAKMYKPPNQALNDYDDLTKYALTIDGYEYANKVWGLGNATDHWAKVQSFKKRGRWQGSFEDLRCCLFAYQRSIRWSESGAYDREGRREFLRIYRAQCTAWEKRRFLPGAVIGNEEELERRAKKSKGGAGPWGSGIGRQRLPNAYFGDNNC